jgi:hypothetical protein
MFCPDGFQTLADTYHKVGDIALQWSRKQPRIEGRKLTQDMTEPEATRWEAYREWLWGRFVNRVAGHLFVTSPEGNALKLDRYAQNFWVGPEEEFPDDPMEQRKLAGRKGDVFYAIRPETFTVDGRHSPPDSDRPDLNNLLEAWHGWPVCWKTLANHLTDASLEELLCDTAYQLLRSAASMYATPPHDPSLPELSGSEEVEAPIVRKLGGRRSMQAPIRKVFLELYPKGKGKTHWVTIVKAINDAGVPCHQRTVLRAVAKLPQR